MRITDPIERAATTSSTILKMSGHNDFLGCGVMDGGVVGAADGVMGAGTLGTDVAGAGV